MDRHFPGGGENGSSDLRRGPTDAPDVFSDAIRGSGGSAGKRGWNAAHGVPRRGRDNAADRGNPRRVEREGQTRSSAARFWRVIRPIMTESAALKIFSLNSRRVRPSSWMSGLMMPCVLRIPRFSSASMAATHASLAALLTFGFSMLVNFLMHWRLKAVSMVESLKSAE